ncbi:MAG: NAD(P)H-hydrate dehydratase [Parachlamydiaceae bacterium]
MKVLSARAMAEAEASAYERGFTHRELMENAGRSIALAVEEFIKKHQLAFRVSLLCGKGNNGGDAFVAGTYLLKKGFEVTSIQLDCLENCSPLCQESAKRFFLEGGRVNRQINFSGLQGIILDGLFGTGFKGEVASPYDALIDAANQSGLAILAIDIPSGLNGSTGEAGMSVIRATQTLFLGYPKTGFFLQEGWNVVGELRHLDIGLPPSLIDPIRGDFMLLTQEHAAALLPAMKRNRHKYQSGDVIGLAGSPNMPGAALLSSLAAFRGGSGMVRLLYPEGMEQSLAASPSELIKIPYSYQAVGEMISLMQKGGSVFIGPGLGRTQEVNTLLQQIVPSLNHPCVIDADALVLYADDPFKLPSQSIFTPHTGEMRTLLHSNDRLILNQELLMRCQEYAEELRVTLILKGAPTFIFHPGSPVFVNSRGDPAMATAGSGDVLTGLLASLLSQGLECHHAALLGVYLHGIAGECAVLERGTSYGMMASDLIAHVGRAYQVIQHGAFKKPHDAALI